MECSDNVAAFGPRFRLRLKCGYKIIETALIMEKRSEKKRDNQTQTDLANQYGGAEEGLVSHGSDEEGHDSGRVTQRCLTRLGSGGF